LKTHDATPMRPGTSGHRAPVLTGGPTPHFLAADCPAVSNRLLVSVTRVRGGVCDKLSFTGFQGRVAPSTLGAWATPVTSLQEPQGSARRNPGRGQASAVHRGFGCFGSVRAPGRGSASTATIDFLVEFDPEASLVDQVGLIQDLERLPRRWVWTSCPPMGLRPRHEGDPGRRLVEL